MNGVCVLDEDNGPHNGPYKYNKVGDDSDIINNIDNGVCACDKPWSGRYCNKIKSLAVQAPSNNNSNSNSNATSIGYQGYGMVPNVTTWGGGILAEKIQQQNDNDAKNITMTDTILYHLYVSRIANNCPLEDFQSNSRIDHAVSNRITGPYTFVDVAIPTYSHNAAPIELAMTPSPSKSHNRKWKYAIFHVGTGMNRIDGGKNCTNNNSHSNKSSTDDGARINRSHIDINPKTWRR